MNTHVDKNMVPDWIQEVVIKLAQQEGISLEQATRLVLFQGAMFYAERIQEQQGNA